mgnify:CR=1 FL=1
MSELQNKKDFQDYLVDPWVRESQAMEIETLRMRNIRAKVIGRDHRLTREESVAYLMWLNEQVNRFNRHVHKPLILGDPNNYQWAVMRNDWPYSARSGPYD